jgi:hypothetical protein
MVLLTFYAIFTLEFLNVLDRVPNEYKLIKSIKPKLKENLTITWADKGKTVVIVENNVLHNKIMEFSLENGLKK